MNNKVLSMLGIATRAGKVVSGEFLVEKSIKRRKAKLVIVATDASDNTKKLFTDKTTFYGVKIYIYSNKENLGISIGKGARASVAVEDSNFANVIEKLISENG